MLCIEVKEKYSQTFQKKKKFAISADKCCIQLHPRKNIEKPVCGEIFVIVHCSEAFKGSHILTPKHMLDVSINFLLTFEFRAISDFQHPKKEKKKY